MPVINDTSFRFLLADDHAMIRSGVTNVLNGLYPGCKLEESVDGTDIAEKLMQRTYDLVIMDIQMGNFNTLSLIHYMHVNYPAIPVLVYSMAPENIYAPRALQAGARGFVSKERLVDDLSNAISVVLSGGRYFSDALVEALCNRVTQKNENPFSDLSPREFQVVSLLLAGKTVTAISNMMALKRSTTGTHKANAFRKLQVNSILALKELSEQFKV